MSRKMKTWKYGLLALLGSLVLSVSLLAQGATRALPTPKIRGFDVEQLDQLAPGNELKFTLYGTPGGVASASVAGTNSRFILDEVEVGVYEGSYTIKRKDHLSPNSKVTTNLRIGNKVASAVLDEPLSGEEHRPPPATGLNPKIDSSDVHPVNSLNAGNELQFTLVGTPGGVASARIAGVQGRVSLEEVRRGTYQGSYPISRRDAVDPYAAVTGNLRLGNQAASMTLSQPLLSAEQDRRRAHARVCSNCAVVENTRAVQVQGDGSYLGLIGGGLVGALVGSQVGHGKGTTLAEVAGAAGGAYAGRQIEKNVRQTTQYEVIVRLQDGGTQAFTYPNDPHFRNGEKVRIENGTLVLDRG